jgi:hypothetical protein
VIDLDAVRRHLAGIERLASEARTSDDLRVVLAALEVLKVQATTIGTFSEEVRSGQWALLISPES